MYNRQSYYHPNWAARNSWPRQPMNWHQAPVPFENVQIAASSPGHAGQLDTPHHQAHNQILCQQRLIGIKLDISPEVPIRSPGLGGKLFVAVPKTAVTVGDVKEHIANIINVSSSMFHLCTGEFRIPDEEVVGILSCVNDLPISVVKTVHSPTIWPSSFGQLVPQSRLPPEILAPPPQDNSSPVRSPPRQIDPLPSRPPRPTQKIVHLQTTTTSKSSGVQQNIFSEDDSCGSGTGGRASCAMKRHCFRTRSQSSSHKIQKSSAGDMNNSLRVSPIAGHSSTAHDHSWSRHRGNVVLGQVSAQESESMDVWSARADQNDNDSDPDINENLKPSNNGDGLTSQSLNISNSSQHHAIRNRKGDDESLSRPSKSLFRLPSMDLSTDEAENLTMSAVNDHNHNSNHGNSNQQGGGFIMNEERTPITECATVQVQSPVASGFFQSSSSHTFVFGSTSCMTNVPLNSFAPQNLPAPNSHSFGSSFRSPSPSTRTPFSNEVFHQAHSSNSIWSAATGVGANIFGGRTGNLNSSSIFDGGPILNRAQGQRTPNNRTPTRGPAEVNSRSTSMSGFRFRLDNEDERLKDDDNSPANAPHNGDISSTSTKNSSMLDGSSNCLHPVLTATIENSDAENSCSVGEYVLTQSRQERIIDQNSQIESETVLNLVVANSHSVESGALEYPNGSSSTMSVNGTSNGQSPQEESIVSVEISPDPTAGDLENLDLPKSSPRPSTSYFRKKQRLFENHRVEKYKNGARGIEPEQEESEGFASSISGTKRNGVVLKRHKRVKRSRKANSVNNAHAAQDLNGDLTDERSVEAPSVGDDEESESADDIKMIGHRKFNYLSFYEKQRLTQSPADIVVGSVICFHTKIASCDDCQVLSDCRWAKVVEVLPDDDFKLKYLQAFQLMASKVEAEDEDSSNFCEVVNWKNMVEARIIENWN